MPTTETVLFAEENRACPLLKWLDGLPAKAQDKCIVRIERLTAMGHDLRRPEADFLRDGIYELRVTLQGVQYRMFYFFHESRAVLTHGLIKRQREVPPREIDLATACRAQYEKDPLKRTHKG